MKLLPFASPKERVRGETGRQAPTVVLVEPDPYLAFLIRLHVPEASVIETESTASGDEIMALHPDLVVAAVDGSGGAIRELLGAETRPKVLAIVDGARASRTTIPSAVDGILARPFVPAELHAAVRVALGLDRPAPGRDRGSLWAQVRSWLPPTRFSAVVLGGVIDVVASDMDRGRIGIAVAALLLVTARWSARWEGSSGEIADIAVTTLAVALTGGVSSSYMPLAIIATAGVGLTRGPRWGGIGGAVVAFGSLRVIIGDLTSDILQLREVVAWFLLMPLVGVTGGFASRLWRSPAHPGFDLLAEANRVLSSLYRIARTIPGGLEIGTVADSAMAEIRDTVRASAGAMLVSEAGSFVVVGSFGLKDPTEVMVRDASAGLGAAVYRNVPIVKRDEMDAITAAALGDHGCWIAAPVKRDGIPLGLLIAACPSHSLHDANRLLLQRLAEEVAVAVENARLFARVREISIDEERRRLARELHDGVAQALTHLRFELDFIARHEPGTIAEMKVEVARLSRVVQRASDDVRSMILGLRSSVSQEGLVGSLRSYLSDLRGLGGPEIIFQTRGEIRLRHEVEVELFRIAQEAVSNALRHAKATTVLVSLHGEGTKVRLGVEDDGVGFPHEEPSSNGGVGLGAMDERADVIGASLEVGARDGGGTRVMVTYIPEDLT